MALRAKFLSKITSTLYQSNLSLNPLQTGVLLARTFKEKKFRERHFPGLTILQNFCISQIFTFADDQHFSGHKLLRMKNFAERVKKHETAKFSVC